MLKALIKSIVNTVEGNPDIAQESQRSSGIVKRTTVKSNLSRLYEDALAENEKLKARLEDSKQELTKIRLQLDSVTQVRAPSSRQEKFGLEKQALEKRVSDMEEELKVLTELKSDNQRLKDENGALIRVISKLSK
uniref:cGMP-dependent protein kinase interacting domain-containing protein n=1 Tax=Electrophorus electricus TaxID=8005 RepID=A0A4W4FHL9_ELEEL